MLTVFVLNRITPSAVEMVQAFKKEPSGETLATLINDNDVEVLARLQAGHLVKTNNGVMYGMVTEQML